METLILIFLMYHLYMYSRGAPPEMSEPRARRRSSMGIRNDTLSMLPEYEDSEDSVEIPRVC